MIRSSSPWRSSLPASPFLSASDGAGSLYSGVLNALYRYGVAAAAPILLNLFFIGAITLVLPHFRDQPGQVLAWTVAAAGLAQLLLLLWAARHAGMDLRMPRPRLTPGVRRLLRLMLPGVLSAGAMQLNLLVGTMIATLQASAVSYLYYADRLYQLPLGIIGIGIGIVLLPELARKLRAGLNEAAHASLNRALEFSLLLTLPATAALLLVPFPIISVLFERGAFDAEAARHRNGTGGLRARSRLCPGQGAAATLLRAAGCGDALASLSSPWPPIWR